LSRFLAIDWGTSALRGALIDDSGAILDERSCRRGLLHIGPGDSRQRSKPNSAIGSICRACAA